MQLSTSFRKINLGPKLKLDPKFADFCMGVSRDFFQKIAKNRHDYKPRNIPSGSELSRMDPRELQDLLQKVSSEEDAATMVRIFNAWANSTPHLPKKPAKRKYRKWDHLADEVESVMKEIGYMTWTTGTDMGLYPENWRSAKHKDIMEKIPNAIEIKEKHLDGSRKFWVYKGFDPVQFYYVESKADISTSPKESAETFYNLQQKHDTVLWRKVIQDELKTGKIFTNTQGMNIEDWHTRFLRPFLRSKGWLFEGGQKYSKRKEEE